MVIDGLHYTEELAIMQSKSADGVHEFVVGKRADGPIMKFAKQGRSCVVTPSLRSRASSERSEGSRLMGTEMLRFAQHDMTHDGR